MGTWYDLAPASAVTPGERICVELPDGLRVAVFNVEGCYYAIDDACTHSGGPLSEGSLDGLRVLCPWHGACFSLTDGKLLKACSPRDHDVRSYPVRVRGLMKKVLQIEVTTDSVD